MLKIPNCILIVVFFPFNTFKTLDEALLIYSKVFKYCGMYEKGTAQWGGPKNSLEKKIKLGGRSFEQ